MHVDVRVGIRENVGEGVGEAEKVEHEADWVPDRLEEWVALALCKADRVRVSVGEPWDPDAVTLWLRLPVPVRVLETVWVEDWLGLPDRRERVSESLLVKVHV